MTTVHSDFSGRGRKAEHSSDPAAHAFLLDLLLHAKEKERYEYETGNIGPGEVLDADDPREWFHWLND